MATSVTCLDMRSLMPALELRSLRTSRSERPVASVHENLFVAERRSDEDCAPPSPHRADDVWIGDVFVVDEQGRDVLQVAVNLSFVERQLGAASAATVRTVRRLTVSAFGAIGATAVHKLIQDNSRKILGFRPEWPWDAAMRRQLAREALHAAYAPDLDSESYAFLPLVLLVVLLAVVAGVAFRSSVFYPAPLATLANGTVG